MTQSAIYNPVNLAIPSLSERGSCPLTRISLQDDRDMIDLFTPVVTTQQRHEHYQALSLPHAEPERRVLESWARGFIDRDGKFVREFQTSFWPSIWELYLNAALRDLGCQIDYSHAAPDFDVRSPAGPFIAEAAVALEAAGYVSERHRPGGELLPRLDVSAMVEYATVRLANTLSTKLDRYRKSYRKLPHVTGRPFVVCIAPYEQPLAFVQNDQAMRRVLYAYDSPVWVGGEGSMGKTVVGHTWSRSVEKDSGAKIQLGFFTDERAVEISAVLFSSVVGVAKLRALAVDSPHDVEFVATRYSATGTDPSLICAGKGRYQETLLDGLHVFLNPLASTPLDPQLFRGRGVAIHYGLDPESGVPVSEVPDGFLFQRMSSLFLRDGLQAGPRLPKDEGLKEPSTRAWEDLHLHAVDGVVGCFRDHHLAHYRGWTILIARDEIDNDWLAQAVKGTARDVSAWIALNRTDVPTVVGSHSHDSKELALAEVAALVDAALAGPL